MALFLHDSNRKFKIRSRKLYTYCMIDMQCDYIEYTATVFTVASIRLPSITISTEIDLTMY